MKFSIDERAEYEALMREAWGDPHHGAKVTADGTREMHRRLLDAAQAGRPWAPEVLETAQLSGLRSIGTKWLKDHSTVPLLSHDGQIVSIPSRGGVRAMNPKTGKPDGPFQQVLFKRMPWPQVRAFLFSLDGQVSALDHDRVALRKLLALYELCPDSINPEDACERLGTTFEEVWAMPLDAIADLAKRDTDDQDAAES